MPSSAWRTGLPEASTRAIGIWSGAITSPSRPTGCQSARRLWRMRSNVMPSRRSAAALTPFSRAWSSNIMTPSLSDSIIVR